MATPPRESHHLDAFNYMTRQHWEETREDGVMFDPMYHDYWNEYLSVVHELSPLKVGDKVTLRGSPLTWRVERLRGNQVQVIWEGKPRYRRVTHRYEILPDGVMSFGEWVTSRGR